MNVAGIACFRQGGSFGRYRCRRDGGIVRGACDLIPEGEEAEKLAFPVLLL